MALQYNPLENNFTTYTPVENPKVTLDLPLLNEPLDISDWSDGITESGNILVKPKLQSKMIVDHPQQQDLIYQQPQQQSTTSKQGLKGNKQKAMNFFMSKGLPAYQAAGIIGNLIGESNLDHTAVNKSSGAYGLAQWLGSRKTALFNKYGKNPTFDQQLNFLWDELQSSEKRAFDSLRSAKTIEAATNSFMRNFERPSEVEMANSISKRIKYARSSLA